MNTKNNIKDAFFSILVKDNDMKLASTCLSALSVVEFPGNEWPELIGILTKNVNSDSKNIRLASLMTLGYMCEDVDP